MFPVLTPLRLRVVSCRGRAVVWCLANLDSWRDMTLERKKNSTPRRQTRTTNNNNNNTSTVTCSSNLSSSLSACTSSPGSRDVASVNNNVGGGDGGKCPISAGGQSHGSADEPINSRNSPSAINVLTSGSSNADQFANRYTPPCTLTIRNFLKFSFWLVAWTRLFR